jgi:hypothetical protein
MQGESAHHALSGGSPTCFLRIAVLQALALRRHAAHPGLLGWIPDACADKAKGDSLLHAHFHSGTDKPMNACPTLLVYASSRSGRQSPGIIQE